MQSSYKFISRQTTIFTIKVIKGQTAPITRAVIVKEVNELQGNQILPSFQASDHLLSKIGTK